MCNNLAYSFQSQTRTPTHTHTHPCALALWHLLVARKRGVLDFFPPYLQLPMHHKWPRNESRPSILQSATCSPFILEQEKKLLKVTEKTAFFPFLKERASIYSDSTAREIKASLSIRNGSTKEPQLDTNLAPHHPFSDIFPGDNPVRPSVCLPIRTVWR